MTLDRNQLRGELLHDYPLAQETSWRVGGKAELLFRPADLADLQFFLSSLPRATGLIWLGAGSNVLIRDGGVLGVVVQLRSQFHNIAQLDDCTIRVEAGVSCAQLVNYCLRHELVDCAYLAGIPGTIGGALTMNAGAFDGEIWNHVVAVETIDRSGLVHIRQKDEFDVSYRHVELPEDEWFIAGHLQFSRGDVKNERNIMRRYMMLRIKSQPVSEHTCGSVFRNPPGDYAARLIDACGLRGYIKGGAQVSKKHPNFIANNDFATARDIEELIAEIQLRVKEHFSLDLQLEVKIYGVK